MEDFGKLYWSEKLDVKRVNNTIVFIAGLFLIFVYGILWVGSLDVRLSNDSTAILFKNILYVVGIIFVLLFAAVVFFSYRRSRKIQKIGDQWIKIFDAGIFFGNEKENEFLSWNEIESIKHGLDIPEDPYDKKSRFQQISVAEGRVLRAGTYRIAQEAIHAAGLHEFRIIGTHEAKGMAHVARWLKKGVKKEEVLRTHFVSIVDGIGFINAIKTLKKENLFDFKILV